jgi:tRNA modification GTPase
MLVFDPVCAIATPPGSAGLAIIRLSGTGCFAIADQCFRGKTTIQAAKSHTILYGTFEQTQGTERLPIDQVTAFVYRAPHSYTGEDVVEFGCHGGSIVSAEVVETLIAAGARHAEPGEFTKRAFLNQKMDLTQVEAVGDLIHAVSKQGSHTAARQLMGGFTRRLAELREKLLELCGLLELELDFSQEDIELIDKSLLAEKIEETRGFCVSLAQSFRSAEIVRAGYSVGIVGYPNAGKSSLLNALLERKRAIVSATPGTTRDYIEEVIHWEGAAIRLIDTAGIRESQDTIEIQGIALAAELLQECHLILVLNDLSEGEHHSNPLLHSLQAKFPEAEFALVQSKTDLVPNYIANDAALSISVQNGNGINHLKHILAQKAHSATETINDALINARQAALLHQAAEYLAKAREAALEGASNEFTALDLRAALKNIGEITGAVWNDDILNAVFGKFCIGK